MKRTISIRVDHRCAFCQHWYDPTNSSIRPIRPQNAVWEYDDQKPGPFLPGLLYYHL